MSKNSLPDLPPIIRKIDEGDWPAVARMQRQCFPPTTVESDEVLQSIWRLSPGTCFFAEAGEPLGYILAHPWIADDLPPTQALLPGLPAQPASVFIHDLAVIPAARGRRIARLLVESVFASARSQFLPYASLIAVQGSQRFWERFQFQPRPELTEKFRETVQRNYQVDFVFMTASLQTATDG